MTTSLLIIPRGTDFTFFIDLIDLEDGAGVEGATVTATFYYEDNGTIAIEPSAMSDAGSGRYTLAVVSTELLTNAKFLQIKVVATISTKTVTSWRNAVVQEDYA